MEEGLPLWMLFCSAASADCPLFLGETNSLSFGEQLGMGREQVGSFNMSRWTSSLCFMRDAVSATERTTYGQGRGCEEQATGCRS
jgi:hypothetical protein